METVIIERPTVELVTLQDVQEALVYPTGTDTTYTNLCITAAREYCENHLGYYLANHRLHVFFDQFPTHGGAIVLPETYLISYSGIQYRNREAQQVSVPTDTYSVSTQAGTTRFFLNPGHAWPTTSGHDQRITLTINVGWTATLIPAAIKAAIIMLVGDLLENREAKQAIQLYENPAVKCLLQPYRVIGL